jgi:hypothetical protein
MRSRLGRARPRSSRSGVALRLLTQRRRLALAFATASVVWWNQAAACGASNWAASLAIGSKGESQADPLPAAPGSVAAACAAPTTAKTITVSWAAVPLATGYSVYDSTTSATGSYTLVASGVPGTSWTSGALSNNTNYWFEVTALIGSNWAGAKSASSGESTINHSSPFCVQP